LDEVTRFKFEFISDDYGFFGVAMLAGVLVAFIGLIGWSRKLAKERRLPMASLVLVSPWAVLLLGYPVAGINVHGAAAPVMALFVPVSLVLSFVLFCMAGNKPSS